jgi:hypothetical protein
MGSLIVNIKTLMEDYMYRLYQKYLEDKGCLILKSGEITGVIEKMYGANSREIKQHVRESLKETMGGEYPSGTVENILLDIFQDRDTNIVKLTNIIQDYQANNYFEVERSIEEDRLGLSIKFDGSFCEIGDIKQKDYEKRDEVNDIITRYQYLYSINGTIIEEQNDAVSFIREIVSNQDKVILGLYRLRE